MSTARERVNWWISKVESTPLGQLQVGKSVVFKDFRLGLLEKGLMVAVSVWCGITLSHAYYSEPTGEPSIQFWFQGESNMMAVANFTCSGEEYDDHDYSCKAAPVYCSSPEDYVRLLPCARARALTVFISARASRIVPFLACPARVVSRAGLQLLSRLRGPVQQHAIPVRLSRLRDEELVG